MGLLARTDFTGGWLPSADSVGAPKNALLRADNLVLDQRGVLGLRQGSSKINGSAFADTDVHSLFTVNLSGTRYRMAGATSAVYANGSSLSTGFAGSGDIQFGSYLGQIVMARSTTKRKYDGSTVRTWGIAAPNAAPTLAVIAADSEVFASWDSSDTANITVDEDDGTGKAFAAGFDATANGALVVNPDEVTGRARATKVHGSPPDFTTYDGGQTGADTDLIEIWVYVTEPQYLVTLTLRIDVNDASFQKDMYGYIFRFQSEFTEENTPVSVGWNLFQVRKDQMIRADGATAGKNWSTVKAVQVEAYCTVGTSVAQLKFDRWRIVGGAQRPLEGLQRYKVVAVYNSSTYTGKSAPSAVSADIEASANGVQLTITSGTITALDTQVNELWVYRNNDVLGGWYRVATLTSGPWVGAQTINDTTSDEDALIANLVLEENVTTPPDTMIGIAGPHYDRLFCLTATHVYPSQPRNLDSYDSVQAIRVGDAAEVAYWITKVREELYIGTSRDVYRLVGDWTVRADGLVNVAKVPMGLGAPPISGAFAQDGDTLLYLASDGWRQLGNDVPLTRGAVDLLYRGQTRHGVSAVNLSTGRFKAALTNGWFTAITPEGASTTSSTVLHRYATALQRWYRHSYSRSWRCVYREPDGTLIASDNAGFVWTLDTGTQDDSTDIAIVLWTPVDDNGQPHQRKDAGEIRIRCNSGGATATASLHLDGSSSASTTVSCTASDLTQKSATLESLAAYTQLQLRVTGSFSTFLWYDYAVQYTEFPVPMGGRILDTSVHTPGQKVLSGLRIRACTIAAARSFTPILDGTLLTAQSFTTHLDQPDDLVLMFSSPQPATDIAWKVDGPIELYDWAPIVDYTLPEGRLVYDSGPIDIGQRVAWITHLEIKAKLTDDLTVTPYIDGVAQTAQTVTAPSGNPVTTFTVPLTRPVRGRQPSVILTSDDDFHLFWVECKYRLTGRDSDLKHAKVQVHA